MLFALIVGFFCDLLLGDPARLPHPVVAVGWLITRLETPLRAALPRTPRGELAGGAVLVVLVGAVSFFAPLAVIRLAYSSWWTLGLFMECVVCYQVLATKCLRDAAMNVYVSLTRGDLDAARQAVSMIVGRDTAHLDAPGIIRATVETVAENASDGVIAPMLYFTLGGAPLALLYKAINTMDSMVGYKNPRYLFFGRAAARLDDAANYLPSRLTALLMIAVANACGLDGKNAARMWRRDRRAHSSPNAGHPESACAGALNIRLGGDSVYGGRLVSKPSLGDAARKPEIEDIVRACRLLYGCALGGFAVCCAGTILAFLFRENMII